MTPLHEHINQVFSDLAFGKEHLEDLVPEVYEGPAMLVWPRGVFHRIRSSDEGTLILNLYSFSWLRWKQVFGANGGSP